MDRSVIYNVSKLNIHKVKTTNTEKDLSEGPKITKLSNESPQGTATEEMLS